MRIRAYGKINLYLQVLDKFPRGKRGYHRLQTIYQTIGLYDEIILSQSEGPEIEISCDHPLVPQGPKNLVYKAVSLLRKYAGVKRGINIEIVKKIPVGAGLGGGSSDAAATLQGLNRLWKLNYTRNTLLPISAQLGCDVPFFLYGHTVLGEGYGEVITPLPGIKNKWVLLVKPDFVLSTKWVYEHLGKIRLTEPINIIKIKTRHSQYGRKRGSSLPGSSLLTIGKIRKILKDGVEKLLYNRLEEVTIAYYPIISQIKKELLEGGADCALMSGSGPTVFALLKDQRLGKKLQQRMEKYKFSTWLVKTV
ncbi:4-(cytidine 5'-diphospho)-2-C-methyl-D-erythritol kinase [bacterium]|nr:4-(cytidine 5'-diphospho)-2-C-methyl-D-erythritol kinase [bacterium]NIN92835.1 4-(cytidine 5'-diphospho)-2-C-methyl-D-erythritol kinase [bacterium]NIO18790.1 4-(cytidine 5'-diphospho)-2-C-methyl-D-erythritol kinase [bacterium]NIO73871.1 4-(cytidine 5'-diphospho)-2-C-methyl-D-erythritol kinase [bacterium]